jgi:ribosomal protein S27E
MEGYAMTTTTRRETRYVDAKCPDCDTPMRVRVGLKSTVRTTRCETCRVSWDYSAWVLKCYQRPTGGRATVHRVDFEKVVTVIQDVEEVKA